jgi:DNA ligase-1
MSYISKPMLAGRIQNDKTEVRYPAFVTPKLDGLRCLIVDRGVVLKDGTKVNGTKYAVTRNFKPIPNAHVQQLLRSLPVGFDGELISGATFSTTSSAIMSEDGTPEFQYLVFDFAGSYNFSRGYTQRIADLIEVVKQMSPRPKWLRVIAPERMDTRDALMAYEQSAVKQGYEGVILRSEHGPYKCGRSTTKEGYLLKLKRMEDSEAEVIGFEELMTNNNVATQDAFGRTKRSSHQENMTPAGTLGKLLVREVGSTPWKGKTFAIGTGDGLTHELRDKIWANRSKYLGQLVTYIYQPTEGYDLPRFPIWKGFRKDL